MSSSDSSSAGVVSPSVLRLMILVEGLTCGADDAHEHRAIFRDSPTELCTLCILCSILGDMLLRRGEEEEEEELRGNVCGGASGIQSGFSVICIICIIYQRHIWNRRISVTTSSIGGRPPVRPEIIIIIILETHGMAYPTMLPVRASTRGIDIGYA